MANFQLAVINQAIFYFSLVEKAIGPNDILGEFHPCSYLFGSLGTCLDVQ